MAEAGEPNAIPGVEVVDLGAVGVELSREEETGDDGSTADGRAEGRGRVWSERAVEVGPEDAGGAGVGAEENDGVG